MAFKKSVFTRIAFKNKRPIDLIKMVSYDDKTDYDNDKTMTFDGPDPNRGEGDPSLSLEIRYDNTGARAEMIKAIEQGLQDLDDDGFTVTIKDGDITRGYTGCFPSSSNPSHEASSKAVFKLDIDVTNRTTT